MQKGSIALSLLLVLSSILILSFTFYDGLLSAFQQHYFLQYQWVSGQLEAQNKEYYQQAEKQCEALNGISLGNNKKIFLQKMREIIKEDFPLFWHCEYQFSAREGKNIWQLQEQSWHDFNAQYLQK